MTDRRPRIAIVGAGPAGLSAALHLTDPVRQPNWRDRYEVHIYQMGWRAGGKGATGRNPHAHERVEEHGIHLFGNFYFNSTRMLAGVLDEVAWDVHDRFRTMHELLLPSQASSGTDYVEGRWEQTLTPMMSSGGDPWTGEVRIDGRDIVGHLLEHMIHIFERAIDAQPPKGALGALERIPRQLIDEWLRGLRRLVQRAIESERKDPAPPGRERHRAVVAELSAKVRQLGAVNRLLPRDAVLRAVYISADLAMTLFRGLIEDEVAQVGVDSIDNENYRDWLERHGASNVTLSSGWPQSIPNTALGYEYGDTTVVPTMSASAFVMFFTRWIMGSGSGAYFFRQGTGDTIIKPLYRTLVQRGVHFHFFHKLVSVTAEGPGDGGLVTSLVFDRQATVLAETYDPLRRLHDGEQVWPDRPRYELLREGEALQRGDELPGGGYDLESWWSAWSPPERLTLTHGEGFDHVILATPIATLPHTCQALLERSTAWRAMTEHLKSAATQAVQLWVDRPTTELGWNAPLTGTDRYLGGIFAQDLTSYCDFSDLIEHERWPAEHRPRGLIYLIGALSDPDEIPGFDDHGYPARQRERVRWMSVQFLRSINGLLPEASSSPIDPRSFDFDMLFPYDPDRRGRGVNQFDQQYWRANVDPNERYTLNVAGSTVYRLDAWDSKFSNLVLAGDWIHTGWNVGSFEAAVMSGKLASLALTGWPGIGEVWGYEFLQRERPGPPAPPFPAP